jgi:putative N6-adenine-specific DNA methylase
MNLFVTAAAGTEGALKDELRELGFRGVRGDRGGVHVDGRREDAALICLRSRVAVRVLVELGRFDCPDEDALYEGVGRFDWERWLTTDRTLAVSAVARDSGLRHTNYIAQRTKDAIVDRQRRLEGRRSSVERHDPDLGVFVHLKRDEAAIFLDASGGSLHLRGWRTEAGAAPLKETLAAALLRIAGWDRASPLVDPLCGSGTFVIEGDLAARGVPPQAPSRRFGFERWADFDARAAERMAELRDALARDARPFGPDCIGSDHDARVIELARQNARRARSRAELRVGAIEDGIAPARGGLVIANPPYGARLEADARFWGALARSLERVEEARIAVLLPEEGPRDLLARAPVAEHSVWNGALACRLLVWASR